MVAAGLFGRHRFRSLFFLWNYGARRVTPVKLAVMNNLKIPLAALTSLLLFREHPNMFLLFIGCLLILASFLIVPISLKTTHKINSRRPIPSELEAPPFSRFGQGWA